jgi:hypothetical protein
VQANPSLQQPDLSVTDVITQRLVAWLARGTQQEGIAQVPELNSAVGTTVGLVRPINEDRAVIARFSSSQHPRQAFVAYIVSDGVGGMKDGAHCAELAVAHFCAGALSDSLGHSQVVFLTRSRAPTGRYSKHIAEVGALPFRQLSSTAQSRSASSMSETVGFIRSPNAAITGSSSDNSPVTTRSKNGSTN